MTVNEQATGLAEKFYNLRKQVAKSMFGAEAPSFADLTAESKKVLILTFVKLINNGVILYKEAEE